MNQMQSRESKPQETVRRFWDQFNSKSPGKVFTVLPENPYVLTKPPAAGFIQGQDVDKSYEEACRECRRAVQCIVVECERVNQKYTDPHFNLEVDLKSNTRNYLDGLGERNDEMFPKGVKRATEIFENPQFFVNGPTAADVRQGRDGDCWAMAALSTMGNKRGLIEKICVARNEKVGVYGFVFYRDGEWKHCIVDDQLYMRAADYDESMDERPVWDDINRSNAEEEYRKAFQTGSRALYFAQCNDENETWLPLLEKAYAKAHGDYSAIEGGLVGEAVEDFTGGVTSEVLLSDILDKDRFWTEELMKVNKEFLFGCGTGLFTNWLYPSYKGPPRDRQGIAENHSYSIMEAREVDGQRLLRLRNPWGKKEWKGAWSDGSAEWTAEWMEKLGHTFGNDGFFWISYEDFLKRYQHLDRTRLFGSDWRVTQHWTTLNVPWSARYHSTRFLIDVKKTSPVVIVLSQLDTRYFKGLAGEYNFYLKFRVQKEGQKGYLLRSQTSYLMARSVNAEITLEPGRYYVLMKVIAHRNEGRPTEDVVREYALTKRHKLFQIGLSYDLAHLKGLNAETDKEKRDREEREDSRKEAERNKLRDDIKRQMQKEWIVERKRAARQRRHADILAGRCPSFRSNGLDGDSTQQQTNGNGNGVQLAMNGNGTNGVRKRRLTLQTDSSFSSKRIRLGFERSRPSLDTRLATNCLDSEDEELLEGFEFDSDIDMPPDNPGQSLAPGPSGEIQETSDTPWNAICVVGLRVYSQDPQLSLQVVHTAEQDDGIEAELDMDDPAATATSEFAPWSRRGFG